MEFENILKLVKAVSDSSLTSFTLEEGGTKISLTAEREPVMAEGTAVKTVIQTAAKENETAAGGEADTAMPETSGNIVKSPLVGTFYNAASPEEEPFVKVGDKVKKGQVLGIIEAMKLMNEVESEYDGTVEAIYVENEEMAEYGQPLFCIR